MFSGIKAIAMDFDGVLTDGAVLWGASGEELKRLSFADITGIARAREAGIHLALVSGESSADGMALVQRFADKVKVRDVYKGCHDKASAIREFAESHSLSLSEICFIGDDVIDVEAMQAAGVAAVPADAQEAAKAVAVFVASRNGGYGAVREVIEAVLTERRNR